MTSIYSRIIAGAIVATFALGGQSAWGSLVCQSVNGLNWCYNPDQCGQACNDVCAVDGLVPLANDAVWFAAQDDAAKCQAIATAFGLSTSGINNDAYACLEDNFGTHSAPGGLLEPLGCSSSGGCPADHRTTMDRPGIPCEQNSSQRSICPCELASRYTTAPALGTTGLIVCVGLIFLVGVTRVYRKPRTRPA